MCHERTAEEAADPNGTNDATRLRLNRDDILDIASREFALTGYRGTNLGQVSDALGVTRQAIYYYFPKKHDLLIALFVRFFDLLDAAADEAAAISSNGRERFDAMLRAHIRIVASDPSISSVFGEGRATFHPPPPNSYSVDASRTTTVSWRHTRRGSPQASSLTTSRR